MTDTAPVAPVATPVDSDVKPPSRLRAFRTKHPRVARAATFTGAVLGAVVVTSAYKNAKAHKEQLVQAGENAKEALSALSDSVTSPDTEA